MKYLYIYNYFAPFEENMCHEEFKVFFNQDFTSRYHFSDLDIPFTRSVFIKDRLNIMSEANTIEELEENIKALDLHYEDYRISYYKNSITHFDYQTSLAYCRRLSPLVNGRSELLQPKTILAFTYIEGTYYFGLLVKNTEWHQHEYKPHSYSHSLPIRVARTAINLGVGTRSDVKIIDPCCGVATVVIEGLSMGLDIIGSDINRDVSYKGRQNVEYYHYDPLLITRKDIHDIEDHYDVSIIDVPYGVYSHVTKEEQLDLIGECARIGERCVAITHEQYDKEFKEMHLNIKNKCYYKKGNFYRYLYVVTKD